jgi:hypothetical protein
MNLKFNILILLRASLRINKCVIGVVQNILLPMDYSDVCLYDSLHLLTLDHMFLFIHQPQY